MQEIFVKLRDTGTLFHDPGQQKTVTRNLICKLIQTALVTQALGAGILVELPKESGEGQYADQEKKREKEARLRDAHTQKLRDAKEELLKPKTVNAPSMANNPVMASPIEVEELPPAETAATEQSIEEETQDNEQEQMPQQPQPFMRGRPRMPR